MLARGWRPPLDTPFSTLIPRHRIEKPSQRNGEEDCADGGQRSKVLPDDVEAGATIKDALGEADGIEKVGQAPFPAGLDAQCDGPWVFGLE